MTSAADRFGQKVNTMDFLTAIETLSPNEALPLLQERFQRNLLFFEKTLPHLATLLKQKTVHYHLYLDSRGINIATADGTLLYPIQEGKSSIFEISKRMVDDLKSNPNCQKHLNQRGVIKYIEPTIPITTTLVNEIVEKAEREDAFDNGGIYFGKEPMLPATSLFGIMSGLQLEYLLRNYRYIHSLFVYEPTVDFFIISNHFVDYENLYAKLGERFFLFVKGELNSHVIKKFYMERMITANYVRFELSLYENERIEQAKKSFLEMQRQNVRGWGTLDDELIGVQNHRKNIDPRNPAYPILANTVTTDVPICVVGSGPSLGDLLPFIKMNREKMVIFSAGTALKPLKDYGIEPDFQIETERRDHVRAVLEEAPLGDTPLMAADVVDPSTLNLARQSYLFIRSASATSRMHAPKKQINFTVPVVGNAAFSLALELGETILMCGLDAGFKDDGKQHIGGSLYDRVDDVAKEKIPTRGNLTKEVFTSPLLALSRHTYETTIAMHPGKKVFNLSDGAYIKGAAPARAESIKLKTVDKKGALKRITAAFETQGVFTRPEQNYRQEMFDYVERFFDTLNVEVRTRQDLFERIDTAFTLTEKQNSEASVTGLFLSGSLRHILNALFTASMHLHSEDISEFFSRAVEESKARLIKNLNEAEPF